MNLGKVFTSNRIAAIAGYLTSLAALIAAFVGVFPSGWENAMLGGVALLTKISTILMYLKGSQNYDTLVSKSIDTKVIATAGQTKAQVPSGLAPTHSERVTGFSKITGEEILS